MNDTSKTVVCFVADFKYLYKHFSRIYEQLRNKGNYKGEILIITNQLTPTFLIKQIRQRFGVTVIRFRKLNFDNATEKSLRNINSVPNRHNTKNFQWHKLYLFHEEMKKWRYIFYFDINMSIHDNINSILDVKPVNQIFARADGYPRYVWKLESQFDKSHPKFKKLSRKFDLDRNDYFQTGLMYFDTNIISSEVFGKILSLIKEYPLSITNEQGILNLYFLFIDQKYTELETYINGKLTYFYWMNKNTDTIITKALTEQNK